MRRLSKEEQNLCIRILNGNGNNNYLQNIIEEKLHDVRIDLNRNTRRVELLFQTQNQFPTSEEGERILSRINILSLEILTAVNLINLLQKEGYILLYQKANKIDDNTSFGGIPTNLNYVAHEFGDTVVSELLIEYSIKEIVVTVEFQEFCKQGFIARDEQRFKKQIGLAYLAFAVALFAAFTNLGFNLWTKFSGGTEIKKHQIESVTSGLNGIENKIDTLNKNIQGLFLLIPDSLKVKTKNKSGQ